MFLPAFRQAAVHILNARESHCGEGGELVGGMALGGGGEWGDGRWNGTSHRLTTSPPPPRPQGQVGRGVNHTDFWLFALCWVRVRTILLIIITTLVQFCSLVPHSLFDFRIL